MASKKDPSDQLPKDFFKQFKDKETFQTFFNSFFKQGIEEQEIALCKSSLKD
ncbi:MAG TPA: hypothetical protein VFU62_10585 [Hanamia sp.]|jgi:hypothetical protein|nr:hypothetical protein [Hanamia sp.]